MLRAISASSAARSTTRSSAGEELYPNDWVKTDWQNRATVSGAANIRAPGLLAHKRG